MKKLTKKQLQANIQAATQSDSILLDMYFTQFRNKDAQKGYVHYIVSDEHKELLGLQETHNSKEVSRCECTDALMKRFADTSLSEKALGLLQRSMDAYLQEHRYLIDESDLQSIYEFFDFAKHVARFKKKSE